MEGRPTQDAAHVLTQRVRELQGERSTDGFTGNGEERTAVLLLGDHREGRTVFMSYADPGNLLLDVQLSQS